MLYTNLSILTALLASLHKLKLWTVFLVVLSEWHTPLVGAHRSWDESLFPNLKDLEKSYVF